MSHLTIRQYMPSDHAAVAELHVCALRQVGIHAQRGRWDADLDNIEAVYLNAGEFLVGELDGRVVAMGALRRTSEERAEVKRMRVSPDCQGRGYGQAILSALEERGRELGYSCLHLDSAVRMAAARHLYEKNGYREVGRTVLGGIDAVLYEKVMAAPAPYSGR